MLCSSKQLVAGWQYFAIVHLMEVSITLTPHVSHQILAEQEAKAKAEKLAWQRAKDCKVLGSKLKRLLKSGMDPEDMDDAIPSKKKAEGKASTMWHTQM